MSDAADGFRAEPDPEWRTRWARLLTTHEHAVRALRPGRRILIGSGAAEPTRLVQAMVDAAWQLSDNELVHLMTLGPAPYTAAACEGRFRHNAFFIGANVREAVRDGRADFTPVFLSEIPHLLKSNRLPVDAVLIQVSPPDAHGMVSLGVSVDIVRAAVDSARLILAEVNPRMPRTPGDTLLDIRRCKHVVAVDTPLPERRAGGDHRGEPRHRRAGGRPRARRGDAADRHRRGSHRGPLLAQEPPRPGHPHRDAFRRSDGAGEARRRQRPPEDARPGQDGGQLPHGQPRALRLGAREP